ncbi:unnamed protein product [Schistosoma margrebowiei]|uniref:Uncharacterized protein n=1 Tax=Schistosoma margrebowiei TaxID=48269 RepID=A0A183MS99_9TREM|nr:unnamed protein product [Schistosoma margrebowiei]
MKTSTSEGKHGIQWTDRMQLNDLDLANDLALLSQMQQQMQKKTTSVAAVACTNPITLDGEVLEDLKTSTYLISIIDEHGGSDADVKARISKARVAYLQLKNIWNSKQLSTNTKQQPTVREEKPDPSRERTQEEALEVDRTHIEESTQLRHKATFHMESSRPKEKRKIKEHITSGNGNRHEKNEQKMDRIRKEGSGRSGLKNAGRWLMLHWE